MHKPIELAKLDLHENKITELTNFNKELTEQVDFRPAEQIWVEGSNEKKFKYF